MPVEIRAACPDDIAPVRTLLADLYDATYAPILGSDRALELHERWHAAEALACQIDQERASFLVAQEAGGRIVGHAFASAVQAPLLFFVRLYVAGSAQRRGLGSRLLDALAARHPDTDRTRLYVVAGNDAALAFYRAQNFTIVGEAEEAGVRSLRLERGA